RRHLPLSAAADGGGCPGRQELYGLSSGWSGSSRRRRQMGRYAIGSSTCGWQPCHCSSVAGASEVVGEVPASAGHPNRSLNSPQRHKEHKEGTNTPCLPCALCVFVVNSSLSCCFRPPVVLPYLA